MHRDVLYRKNGGYKRRFLFYIGFIQFEIYR